MTHGEGMALLDTDEAMRQVKDLQIGQSYGGGRGLFRPMTLDEARQLPFGSRQWFVSLNGQAKQVTVTSVKTWKRKPTLVQINVRFGLYEHATFANDDVDSRLLVQLTKEQTDAYMTWLQYMVGLAARQVCV